MNKYNFSNQFLKDERMSLPFGGKKGTKVDICLHTHSILIFIVHTKQRAEHFRTLETRENIKFLSQ